jgi:hypothetical protein
MLGPPGAGKSRLARRLATLLPAMRLAAARETTSIPRVAGLTGGRTAVVTTRPFLAPHHTISEVGLIGGGQLSLPGEVSLAHHDLLFRDERPACRRQILEVLRQPLEDGVTETPPRGRLGSDGAGGVSRAHAPRHVLACDMTGCHTYRDGSGPAPMVRYPPAVRHR